MTTGQAKLLGSVVVLTVTGVSPALADEGELHIAAQPTMHLLQRHNFTNVGFGGRVQAALGLHDMLDVEFALACDHFLRLKQSGVQSSGSLTGELFYDTTRCSAVPSLGLRLGARWVGTASLGVGYRVEVQSRRVLGSVDGIELERPEPRTLHQAILNYRFQGEFRVTPWLSATVLGGLTTTLAGGHRELDFMFGVGAALYFYP